MGGSTVIYGTINASKIIYINIIYYSEHVYKHTYTQSTTER